jgi:hypothetical protein
MPAMRLAAPYLNQDQGAQRTASGEGAVAGDARAQAAVAGAANADATQARKDATGAPVTGAVTEGGVATADGVSSSAASHVQTADITAQSRTAGGEAALAATGGGGPVGEGNIAARGSSATNDMAASDQATFSRRTGSGISPVVMSSMAVGFAATPEQREWLDLQHANIPWFGAKQSVFPVAEEALRPVVMQTSPIRFSTATTTTDQSKISTTQFDYGKIWQMQNQGDLLADARFNRFGPTVSAVGLGSATAKNWGGLVDWRRGIVRTVSATENDHLHNMDKLEATIEHRDGPNVGAGGGGNTPNQPVMAGAVAGQTDPTGVNQDPQGVQIAATQPPARPQDEQT